MTKVLFAPNAGPGVGGGHVMRCLSLATALQRRGAEVVFAAPPAALPIIERFAERPPAFAEAGDLAGVLAAAGALRPDLAVLDHYGWGATEEESLRKHTPVLAALDDLAERAHEVDLLSDPSFGRAPADYGGKVPGDARLLLGPNYALLRPEFSSIRVEQRRRTRRSRRAGYRSEIRRVFVSFGLSDVSGIAERATRLLRSHLPSASIDVALASDAPSRAGLERAAELDPNLVIHIDTPAVAQLLSVADLAVGAGGSATWERVCLEKPSLAVIVAENQRALLTELDDQGFLLACDLSSPAFESDFRGKLEYLMDPILRGHLSQRGGALCDGRGAERAAEALLALLGDQG